MKELIKKDIQKQIDLLTRKIELDHKDYQERIKKIKETLKAL